MQFLNTSTTSTVSMKIFCQSRERCFAAREQAPVQDNSVARQIKFVLPVLNCCSLFCISILQPLSHIYAYAVQSFDLETISTFHDGHCYSLDLLRRVFFMLGHANIVFYTGQYALDTDAIDTTLDASTRKNHSNLKFDYFTCSNGLQLRSDSTRFPTLGLSKMAYVNNSQHACFCNIYENTSQE